MSEKGAKNLMQSTPSILRDYPQTKPVILSRDGKNIEETAARLRERNLKNPKKAKNGKSFTVFHMGEKEPRGKAPRRGG